ncbi:MAG TPA: S53 family peptidase [Streptosporangiaceae bacterium]|nr:S53 family peptidase [Streptosporangiaceae bacterium]
MPLTRLRMLTTAAAAGALALSGVTAAAAAPAPQRTAIAGTHPAWAIAARRVGSAAVSAGTVSARVYLAGRDQAGLAAYATAASTPGNALYGHYLTPGQVLERYGPTGAQIAAVESWLRSAGLVVTGTDGQMAGYIAVTGSVAAARQAFGVGFGTFKAPDGRAYRAPDQAATAPSSVAGDVLTVSGLDTAPHLMKPGLPPPGPNYWVAPPCSSYYGQKIATSEPTAYGRRQPWNNCGYTQRQIRGAYGVTRSGMTGRGQTVAIVDAYASPTMPADANEFAKVTGDKPLRPGQYTQHLDRPFTLAGPDECDAQGWYGEETLDIEAVHGQAPDASVRFVAAASCEDSDLANALAYIVNNHLASIVSDSWGEPADQAVITNVFDLIFEAGAAEGIGFFFSSGDNGYESPAEDPGSDQTQVDYPTSSPWVTSVGGTSLAIGKRGNYRWETSWGTLLDPLASNGTSWSSAPPGDYPAGYDGSSGGGTSTLYQQPFYQAGVVPAALSHRLPDGTISSVAMREVPDVSALADPGTGMLVGQTILEPDGTTYGFALSRIGGTSVACPTFAGIQADAQQAAGHPLGFADPAIYRRYGTTAFRDVTDHPLGPGYLAQVRNNYTDPSTKAGPLLTYLRTLGIDGEGAAALPATKGYDDATGVGSPRGYIESFRR